MADWKSVKSISDKYGISVERVIAWVRESQITTSVVGSVVLIDDGSVCELVEKEKRLAHLKTRSLSSASRRNCVQTKMPDSRCVFWMISSPFCTDYSA